MGLMSRFRRPLNSGHQKRHLKSRIELIWCSQTPSSSYRKHRVCQREMRVEILMLVTRNSSQERKDELRLVISKELRNSLLSRNPWQENASEVDWLNQRAKRVPRCCASRSSKSNWKSLKVISLNKRALDRVTKWRARLRKRSWTSKSLP